MHNHLDLDRWGPGTVSREGRVGDVTCDGRGPIITCRGGDTHGQTDTPGVYGHGCEACYNTPPEWLLCHVISMRVDFGWKMFLSYCFWRKAGGALPHSGPPWLPSVPYLI